MIRDVSTPSPFELFLEQYVCGQSDRSKYPGSLPPLHLTGDELEEERKREKVGCRTSILLLPSKCFSLTLIQVVSK